jgi:parallel beta-helix repeat protein
VIDHCLVQFADNLGDGAIHAFAANGAAGMRISNCEISYNSTQGITVFSSNIIIRNNYIHHNYASAYQKGAGIYFWAGNPKVVNNIISHNESAAEGGGMCMDWDARPTLIGNVITYNKAWRAGGICDYAGGFEVINNTIAFNTSTGSIGGGYYTLYAGLTKFTNSIIAHNLPTQVEIADWTTTIGFRNCILQGGKESIEMYGDNLFLYENTIADDPKLISGKNGHGRLMPGSPAVDGGTTTGIALTLPSSDVVGNTRVAGSQIDIGAYEDVADPPLTLVGTIADEYKEEDFVPFMIPVESIFGYQYGSNFLSYYIADETPLLNVEVRDQTLYLTPVVDRFGDQTVKLTASTGISEITTTFVIHIAPIDDPPEFRVEPSYTQYEDFIDLVSYPVEIIHHYGEEDQTQSFKLEPATIDFATLQFSTQDGSLNILSKPDLYGTQKFTLTMIEGDESRSEDFTFTVRPVNDAPAITIDKSAISISVDELKVIPVTVSDVDGDDVTFFSSPLNSAIATSRSATGVNQYNITITGMLIGPSGIYIAAHDGRESTDLTIPVTVEPVLGLEGESLSYAAYPNPAVEEIIVRAKAKSTIVMYNARGLVVLATEMHNSDITLDVGHLKPGLYLLSVNDGTSAKVFRVLKR